MPKAKKSSVPALNFKTMQNHKIDKSNLRDVILSFPEQFKIGLELAKNIKPKGSYRNLAISGMGGSSLPADILRVYLNEIYENKQEKKDKISIFQNRFYSLPHEAYDKCLNFFASYSGNTEETISSLNEAIEKKLPSIGLATSGKVLELCQEHDIPCVLLPAGIQPRYATGYFFGAMFRILVNAGMISDSSEEIIRSAENLKLETSKLENKGKELAQKLVGKTPIIYASNKYNAIAMIWKIKINENAKTPAFYNFFPELNHNEMVGFTLPQGQFHVIILKDNKDHPQNLKRMDATAALLQKKGIDSSIIEMPNTNTFNSIFETLLLGDWTSYYLSLAYNQDPTPVDMVEDLKKILAE